MKSARDVILPSLFGDALALGAHWEYDSERIAAWYPAGFPGFDAPRGKYHTGKKGGDFTHYGDQALVLLESLASASGSLANWRDDWWRWARQARQDGTIYLDGATRETLENLEAGGNDPSGSSDLGGAARIAPLFAADAETELLVELARGQTARTHGDPRVIDAAEFFARSVASVAAGADFEEAFDEAASHPYDALPAIDWLAAGRQAAADLPVIDGAPGLGCGVAGAFPLSIAIAFRYESEPVEALQRNVMLGGDSAARGLVIGMLQGARHGLEAFPREWSAELNAGPRIETAIHLLGSR